MSATAVGMPKLGMTMTEGRVVAWPVPLGGRVEKDAVVLVIESEKAEIEIESPAAGHLRHVYVPADRTVPCGTLLAALTTTMDEAFDADAFRRDHDRPERTVVTPAPRADRAVASGAARQDGAASRAAPITPAARALARDLGIDVAVVAGTGPQGRVTREDVEAHAAARERLVPVGGGVSLEVLGQGSGEPVVLIPGFGSDGSAFALQVPALVAGHRVLAVNPRGAGLSDAPDEPVYTVATAARELLAAAGGPAHLVGASLGAAVAMEAALQGPERVRSLALITPFVSASPRLLAVLESWCRVATESSAETLAATLLPWLFSTDHLADDRARGRTLRGLAQMLARVAPSSLARHAAGLRVWSGTRASDLQRLRVPVLVVAGSEDLLTPDARDVADAIPDSQFLAIGDAGHAVALEQPETVNAALVRHLRGR